MRCLSSTAVAVFAALVGLSMAFPVMHTNGTAGLAPSSNTTVGLLAQNGSTAVHKTLAEHDLDLSIYLWDPMSNREAVVEGEDVKDDGGMDGMHIEKRDHPPWDEKLTSAWDKYAEGGWPQARKNCWNKNSHIAGMHLDSLTLQDYCKDKKIQRTWIEKHVIRECMMKELGRTHENMHEAAVRLRKWLLEVCEIDVYKEWR